MDVDALDQWLDDDGVDGRSGERRGPGTPSGGASRRASWRWIAVAAAALWAAVMAVVLLGGDGTDVETADPLPPMSDVLHPADDLATFADGGLGDASEGPSESRMATDETSPTAPSEGVDGTMAGAITSQASADGLVGAAGWPPGIEAGAVRALRHHLTTQGPPATYLEWATPVAARQLDAGMWVVEVEAVWLQDDEAQLDRARVGVWAVPLGDGGQPLGPPWPLADAAPPPPPSELPTGQTRLPEVQLGLTTSGWHDVTAVAADPHPLLPDVVVALVEGTPPAGDATTAAVLWLIESADGGLTPLGARP